MSIVVARPTGELSGSSVRRDRTGERLLLAGTTILALIWLIAWRATQPPAPSPAVLKPTHPGPMTMYIVEEGDTVDGIAARFGLPESALIRANHLANAGLIQVGQTLLIPGGHPAHMGVGRPRALVQLIERIAGRFGVDRSLALAVAWQESRLRQNRRSSKGAVGVMQVEPATAAMVAQQLGWPLDIRQVRDNVIAGIYWLSYLLRAYGSDQVRALAAYYEGQGNLARYGYPPTVRAYVANVMALRGGLP